MPASAQGDQTYSPVPARRLTAVAFADIVGYSILMADDEQGTLTRWTALLNDVLRPAAERHRGKIIKLTGDGVLAEFPSALDAVEWGKDVQHANRLAGASEGAEQPRLVLRIAVHIGDVVTTDNDVYGDAINLAARLQEHAPPGGIVLSEAVYDLVRGNVCQQPDDLGLLKLKNFERPVRAFAFPPASQNSIGPARAALPSIPSIAVLPFLNLSGDPGDDYFASGVIEDIIISLAALQELMVIARTSTLAFNKPQQQDPREVGRALGVRYVLMGSVRRSAQLLRVSVQLCDAQTGATLWGDTTETALGDLFEVQDNVVFKIVAGVAPHVRSAELRDALRRRPQNFTAYDYTLRALHLINSLDQPTFREAREFLSKAMAADQSFAMPCAWAARWHSLNIGQGWSLARQEDAATAVRLAERAIDLDQRNALALATYAHLKSYLFHDCDTALVHFDQALSTSPNDALAWILSSATLAYVGRSEQAVRHAQRGLRLSPLDQSRFYYYFFLGLAHYANRDYYEAVKWGRLSQSANPRYTANLRVFTASLSALGRLDEAREVAQSLMRREPTFSLSDYDRTIQPFRDSELRVRFINDLTKAGLPP
jgi:adenylate cyclase